MSGIFIPAKYLNIYEAAGGADFAEPLRCVHVSRPPMSQYFVEATDNNLCVVISGPTDSGESTRTLTDESSLFSKTDVQTVTAKEQSGAIIISTSKVFDNEGDENRETKIQTVDGTEITIHASGEDYPTFGQYTAEERERPRLNLCFSRKAFVKACKLFAKVSDQDTFTLRMPLDGIYSSLMLSGVNEDGAEIEVFLNPVSEFTMSPLEQFQNLLEGAKVQAGNVSVEDPEIVASMRRFLSAVQTLEDLIALNSHKITLGSQEEINQVTIKAVDQANDMHRSTVAANQPVETPDMLGDSP